MKRQKQRQILGLDLDLLWALLVVWGIFAIAMILTSCELLSSAQDSADKAGTAAEQIGDSVAETLSTINWAITALVGYIIGEFRRPITQLAKKVINGRKNNSACAAAAGKRMRGK